MAQVHRPCVFPFVAWFMEHSPTEGSVLQPLPRGRDFDVINPRLANATLCRSDAAGYQTYAVIVVFYKSACLLSWPFQVHPQRLQPLKSRSLLYLLAT
jgi:hypothetical protein